MEDHGEEAHRIGGKHVLELADDPDVVARRRRDGVRVVDAVADFGGRDLAPLRAVPVHGQRSVTVADRPDIVVVDRGDIVQVSVATMGLERHPFDRVPLGAVVAHHQRPGGLRVDPHDAHGPDFAPGGRRCAVERVPETDVRLRGHRDFDPLGTVPLQGEVLGILLSQGEDPGGAQALDLEQAVLSRTGVGTVDYGPGPVLRAGGQRCPRNRCPQDAEGHRGMRF